MKTFRLIAVLAVIFALLFSSCNADVDAGGKAGNMENEPQDSINETEDELKEKTGWDTENESYKALIDDLVFSGGAFGEAFIGCLEGPRETGYAEFFEERGYMDLYPFIADIPYERYIEAGGNEMYCIVPKYIDSFIEVYKWIYDSASENFYCGELIYESETGEPFFIICNGYETDSKTYVVITEPNGTVHEFVPELDLDGEWLNTYESGESFAIDFSFYKDVVARAFSFDELVGDWSASYDTEDGKTIDILFSFYYSEYNEPCVIFQFGEHYGETIGYYEGTVYDEYSGFDGEATGNLILQMTLTDGTLFDEKGEGLYKVLYSFREAFWNKEIVLVNSFGGDEIMPGYEIVFMEIHKAFG